MRRVFYVLPVLFVFLAVGYAQVRRDVQRLANDQRATILPAVEEMLEQAGTADVATRLLDLIDRGDPPADVAADAARYRCKLGHVMRGPNRGVLDLCGLALGMARRAGGEALEQKALIRLTLVYTDAGQLDEAAKYAALLHVPDNDPITAAFVHWAKGGLLLKQKKWAVDEMGMASEAIQVAVRHDENKAEFQAIADFRRAQALMAAAQIADATAAIESAILRQRHLVEKNDGYAEYSLFLVRMLHLRGNLGDEAAAEEAKELADELLDRDPKRYEYQVEAGCE